MNRRGFLGRLAAITGVLAAAPAVPPPQVGGVESWHIRPAVPVGPPRGYMMLWWGPSEEIPAGWRSVDDFDTDFLLGDRVTAINHTHTLNSHTHSVGTVAVYHEHTHPAWYGPPAAVPVTIEYTG